MRRIDLTSITKDASNTYPLLWPTESKQITVMFGQVDKIYQKKHVGIDIQGNEGSNVISSVNGKVIFAGNRGDAYGNVVIINTKYYDKNIQVRYSHLMDDLYVSAGDIVAPGDLIGKMGHSGETNNSTAYPHNLINFEVLESTDGTECKVDGSNVIDVDPLKYFGPIYNEDKSYLSGLPAIGNTPRDEFMINSVDAAATNPGDDYAARNKARYFLENKDANGNPFTNGEAYLKKLLDSYGQEHKLSSEYVEKMASWNSPKGWTVVTCGIFNIVCYTGAAPTEDEIYGYPTIQAQIINDRTVVNAHDFCAKFNDLVNSNNIITAKYNIKTLMSWGLLTYRNIKMDENWVSGDNFNSALLEFAKIYYPDIHYDTPTLFCWVQNKVQEANDKPILKTKNNLNILMSRNLLAYRKLTFDSMWDSVFDASLHDFVDIYHKGESYTPPQLFQWVQHKVDEGASNFDYGSDGDDVYTPVNINAADMLRIMPGTWLTAELIDALHQLGIVDVNAFINNTANKLINELGLEYITWNDVGYYIYGIMMSADDNLFLGGAQKIAGLFGKIPPEDNHYFMLGKVMADGMFLGAFLRTAGMAVVDAARAMATAAGSGALGLLTSETGIGFAVFETAAGAELIEAATATCVAAVASAGAVNSATVLSKDAQKYANTKQPELSPSKILKNNMISKKIMKFPPFKFATHHIVAWNSQYAAGARNILGKYGIEINDAENGVFLAIEEGKGTCNHTTLHTANYYRNVENMLKSATSKQEVINILDAIRQQLINGAFPH